MFKDDTLECLYKQYREDPWLKDLLDAAGLTVGQVADRVAALPDQMFLETMSWQLAIEERMAGLSPAPGAHIEDRKSVLSAKWRSGGKAGASELQMVADSWSNGRTAVDFVDNKIQVTFTGEYGLPSDRAGLENALEEVKPAHLPIYYLVRYILIRDISAMAVRDIEAHKIKEFAFADKGRRT